MPSSSAIPSSVATKTLKRVKSGLEDTNKFLIKAHPPIAELVVIVNRLDGYITEALEFMSLADELAKFVHEALQITKYLAELIPTIGPIIASAANVIEKFRIEETIRKIIHEMRVVVENGQDKLLKEVRAGANFVSTKLEDAVTQLPQWQDTIGLMVKLFGLIDIGVFVLFDEDTKDEIVKKVLNALKDMSGGALKNIEAVKKAVQPILDFVGGVWITFKNAVLKPLQGAFGSIMSVFRSVMGVVKECIGVCNTIKHWFEPFFWVLHAIQWVFERTVGWLVDKVLNQLGLRDFIKRFVNEIKSALGIDTIQEELKNMMGPILDGVGRPLKQIMASTGVESIEETIKQFALHLQGWRKDPAGSLFAIVEKAITDGKWDPDTPQPPPDPDDDDDDFLAVVAPAGDPGAIEVREITEIQQSLDTFIAQAGVASRHDLNQQHVTTEAASAPKLGYAFHDDRPVSVLLRLSHKRVLDKQRGASSKPLPPLKPLALSSPDETVSFATSSSDGKIPEFDKYLVKHESLLKEVKIATLSLDRITDAAQQADADFASYASEAVNFCDHFVSSLVGFDPILEAVTGLLGLPLKYRKVLTEDFVKVIHDAGLPASVAEAIPLLFAIIDKTEDSIENIATQKKALQDHSSHVVEIYRAFHDQVAHVCSPKRFPSSLGTGVRDISSFVHFLQERANSSAQCFTFIKNLGQTILDNQDKLKGNPDEVFAKLNDIFAHVNSVVDSTIKELQDTPAAIEGLYKALSDVHSDVQTFFKATEAISGHCRAVELKIIAADRTKDLCNRINNAIGPFESILLQLGVKPDRPDGKPPPSPAEVLKLIGKHIGGPFRIISNLIKNAVFPRLEAVLNHYFELSTLEQELNDLSENLQRPLTDHVKAFDAAIQRLINIVAPKKTSTYSVQPSDESGGGSHNATSFAVPNPVVDDARSRELGKILDEVTKLADGIEWDEEKQPIPPNAIRIPKWAKPGVDERPVKSLYLTTWGRTWDDAEPEYPSSVYIGWYNLLQGLEDVMKKRASWQRLDGSTSPLEPPTTLPGSDVDLWKLLEAKATVGGSLYTPTIVKPFQEPLYDRIDQLLKGVVELPSGNNGDFFKLLPLPVDSSQVPPRSNLPEPAVKVAKSAFADGQIPTSLGEVFGDQETFEDISFDLRRHFVAKADVGPAASAALDELHLDYNLMDGRKLLELSSDGVKTKEFVKLAGSGSRLG